MQNGKFIIRGEGMALEAKGRNAAGHQKQWEPGTETALGCSPCLFSLFLSIITYTCFLLHSVCLQSYIFKSLLLTEEKNMPTDSELYFSHTWTQRETSPIFAPNMSIKPNMEVMLIIVVTEALVVDNYWFLCLVLGPAPLPYLLTCLK